MIVRILKMFVIFFVSLQLVGKNQQVHYNTHTELNCLLFIPQIQAHIHPPPSLHLLPTRDADYNTGFLRLINGRSVCKLTLQPVFIVLHFTVYKIKVRDIAQSHH